MTYKKNDMKLALEKMVSEINAVKFDPLKDIATHNDFNNIMAVETHDYDSETDKINTESFNIINNLAKAYLGSLELIKEPSIKDKIKKDAEAYANLNFLIKNIQRHIITLSKKIDQGGDSDQSYTTLITLQKEMRETVKSATAHLVNTESFYKKIKDEFDNKILNKKDDIEENDKKDKDPTALVVAEATNFVSVGNKKDLNIELEEFIKNNNLSKK